MSKVGRYKEMYRRGLIIIEQLQKLVEKGILTQKEYKEIVGENGK